MTEGKVDGKAGKKSFSLKTFLLNVRDELKRVSWPSKDELVSYTGVVFVAVIVVCTLIWVCDTVFGRIMAFLLS